MGDTVESPLAHHGFDPVPFPRRAALERMNHRHRDFSFAQIAGHRLPQHRLRGSQIEHVVDDLKGDPQIQPVLGQTLFLLRCGPTEDCAHPHAHRKQARCLAKNQVEVFIERNQLAQLLHLKQFALYHLLRQIDERVQNAEVALLDRNLEPLHIQPVTRQHAFRIAPLRVGCRPPAPGVGFVNNVIMHQRGRVNDLHHRAQSNRAASSIVKQFGGEQQQRRTNAFPASSAQILPDLGDCAYARDCVTPELALNRG